MHERGEQPPPPPPIIPLIIETRPKIHFGAAYPLSFASIIRAKVPDPRTQRRIALEGHRFAPPEALAAGLVDYLVQGDTEAVIARAQALGESVSHLAARGAWGVIKVWIEVNALWGRC